MTGRLHDRVALVTGSARGIGLAAARALAEQGARVLLCDRDEDVVQDAADDLRKDGLTVRAVKADVSSQASIAQACPNKRAGPTKTGAGERLCWAARPTISRVWA